MTVATADGTTRQIDITVNGADDATVIEAFGSTRLVLMGDQYHLWDSDGVGPTVKMGGVPIQASTQGAWTIIAGEQTDTGYLIAWKNGSADQFIVWRLNDSGSYTANATATVPGSDAALRQLETDFHQDLNSSGHIGTQTDLVVSSITAGPSVVQGALFNFSYVIENSGLESAASSWAGFRIDQQPDQFNVAGFNPSGGLAAGGTQTLTNSINTSASASAATRST